PIQGKGLRSILHYFTRISARAHNPLPVEKIVQAQGWIINEQGKVRLVAYKTDPNSSPTEPIDTQVCHQ
ncbi:MAG: hypothetical protein AB4372_03100, partial [Xenococcus sp. (in: cyanobacteria)]